MRAVGPGRERDVDAVVDQKRHVERREHPLDCPRACQHQPRVAVFVAQLHERRTALRDQPRQHGGIAPERVFGIDKSVKAKINTHSTNSFSSSFGPSREAARAGIHNHCPWLWIPGWRASAAPRNDRLELGHLILHRHPHSILQPSRTTHRAYHELRRCARDELRSRPDERGELRDPAYRHRASSRAFTPVLDGLWTRVNALMAHAGYAGMPPALASRSRICWIAPAAEARG